MKYYELEEGNYPSEKKDTSKDKFINDGWSIEKDGNKYILKYLSGEMQGRLKEVFITYDDYLLLKDGKISLFYFC